MPPSEEPKTEAPKEPEKQPDKPAQKAPEKQKTPPKEPEPPIDQFHDPTNSQDFYNWLTDRNPFNIKESEKVLFRPRPV